MRSIKRKLAPGEHVIGLPIGKTACIGDLFPVEIAGSSLQKMLPNGHWGDIFEIIFDDNRLTTSSGDLELYPLNVLKLTLTREIDINWNVSFSPQHLSLSDRALLSNRFDYPSALYLSKLCAISYDSCNDIGSVLRENFNIEHFSSFTIRTHSLNFPQGLWKMLKSLGSGKGYYSVDLQFVQLYRPNLSNGVDDVIVIFRGSDSFVDWLTNFNIKSESFYGKGRVHRGFYHSFKEFIETKHHEKLKKIKDIINDDLKNGSRLILTGHSLGGAVATLVACYLTEQGTPKEQLVTYTYGAPPVGDDAFCLNFNGKLNLYRIFNTRDPVVSLPERIRLDHVGESFPLRYNSSLIDVHSIESYKETLLDCL